MLSFRYKKGYTLSDKVTGRVKDKQIHKGALLLTKRKSGGSLHICTTNYNNNTLGPLVLILDDISEIAAKV